MTHWLFVIVKNAIIDESLAVSLNPSVREND